jgi:tight adherence protein B
MDPIIISGIVFVGVVGLVGSIAFMMRDMGATSTESRLEILTGKKQPKGEAVSKGELVREGMDGLTGVVGGIVSRMGNFALLFEQANVTISVEKFLGICLIGGVLGTAIPLILHAHPALIPVGTLVGASLPLLWLLHKRNTRFKKFAAQLPDALELIARALRSGHALSSGLHVVVEEMPNPIAEEFNNAYEEQNLGIPIEQALKNMLKRIPNLDLKFFVTAVAIQRQSGGDLAEILDKIGHIVRERFKIVGQVAALTGEGRISGIVLMALPIVLFLAVLYLNPSYVLLLFEEELGRKMIVGAIVLQILGAVCIKKIINIKV